MQHKNWGKNHLHLIREPSEYGWSDELTIIIQSTKENNTIKCMQFTAF